MLGLKAKRLLRRIGSELGRDLPEDAYIQRTYAGRNQKAEGAFAWFVESPSQMVWPPVGSGWTVTGLLKADKLSIVDSFGSDQEVIPDVTVQECIKKGIE